MRITGEIFEPNGGTPEILASLPTLSGLDPQLTVVQYDVALRPGTATASYAHALATALGPDYSVSASNATPSEFAAVIGLIATLTLLLAAVAGLGVLNTVVLQTRERVHDLGVFKAVGMTPRQLSAMVVCSAAGIGLVAGLVAVPAGVALQRYVLPVMAHAAQTGVPASVLDVYVTRRARPARAVRPGHRRGGGAGPGGLGGPRPHRLRPARRVDRDLSLHIISIRATPAILTRGEVSGSWHRLS